MCVCMNRWLAVAAAAALILGPAQQECKSTVVSPADSTAEKRPSDNAPIPKGSAGEKPDLSKLSVKELFQSMRPMDYWKTSIHVELAKRWGLPDEFQDRGRGVHAAVSDDRQYILFFLGQATLDIPGPGVPSFFGWRLILVDEQGKILWDKKMSFAQWPAVSNTGTVAVPEWLAFGKTGFNPRPDLLEGLTRVELCLIDKKGTITSRFTRTRPKELESNAPFGLVPAHGFSADGKRYCCVSLGETGDVKLFCLDVTGKEIWSTDLEEPWERSNNNEIHVSSDGKHVVLANIHRGSSEGFVAFSDAGRVRLRGSLGKNRRVSFRQGTLVVQDDDGVRTFDLDKRDAASPRVKPHDRTTRVLGIETAAPSGEAVDGVQADILGQIYDAESGRERDKLIENFVALGPSAEQLLRKVARQTHDGRIFWGLTEVARRTKDARIARILTKRLVDPDDHFLPGYLGAGVVKIKGEDCYEEFRALALESAPEVRARIIKGIGYSGYVTAHNPVPTLISLAGVLSGDEKEVVYRQALFVLKQRGSRVTSETEQIQFARCLLPWIFPDQTVPGGSSETKDMGKCPYPPEGHELHLPFGLAFEKASGGRHCYTLESGAVRKTDSEALRSELPVTLRCRGDFAGAFFVVREGFSHLTTVEVLFKRVGGAWQYGGHVRVSSVIVDAR